MGRAGYNAPPIRISSLLSQHRPEGSQYTQSDSDGSVSHDDSVSTPVHPELVDEPEWGDWESLQRRESLKKRIESEKRALSFDGFREVYQPAIKACVYDKEAGAEETILHYLIRTLELRSFKNSQPFHWLIEISLEELGARLGPSGLGDSLHRAIERRHFDIIECICAKTKEGKLKDLVASAIACIKSGQNCLHAVFATDPRDIKVMNTLITHAPKDAFKARREPNGNSPLHDFVEFKGKWFKICKCRCKKKCASAFPLDSVGDEHQYTALFLEALGNLIKECPEALSMSNEDGKTPYVVNRESRKKAVPDKAWDDIEYSFGEGGNPAGPYGTNDQSTGAVASPTITHNGSGDNISSPIQSNGMDGISSSAHQRPGYLKDKKASSATMDSSLSRNAGAHDENGWVYSEHLAREVSRYLLEACCSQPSWNVAVKSLFGDRRLEGESMVSAKETVRPFRLTHPRMKDETSLQTSFKTDDALYKDIEADYEFLSLNSILAHVELSLTDPRPEVGLDPDDMTSHNLRVDEMDEMSQKKLTPKLIRRKNASYLRAVFEWLRQKGVRRILKLVIVDNQEWQCGDETIEDCLHGWDIRYLDWNKRDLSIETIKTGGAAKLVELWLTWSGQNTALLGWSDPDYGLKQQLPKV